MHHPSEIMFVKQMWERKKLSYVFEVVPFTNTSIAKDFTIARPFGIEFGIESHQSKISEPYDIPTHTIYIDRSPGIPMV